LQLSILNGTVSLSKIMNVSVYSKLNLERSQIPSHGLYKELVKKLV
jgi:hypothetical protein